ncbi:MAG: adenosylcobinamide-phosphate synthase CbiB, partial [Geminicoccaceae bacterium]
ALGLRLAGPRRYAGQRVDDAWMGSGRAGATPTDIRRALHLFVLACGFTAALLVMLALLAV